MRDTHITTLQLPGERMPFTSERWRALLGMGEIPDKVSADIVLAYLRGQWIAFHDMLPPDPDVSDLDSPVGGALVFIHTMAEELLGVDLEEW